MRSSAARGNLLKAWRGSATGSDRVLLFHPPIRGQTSVLVRNLLREATTDDLRREFGKFGTGDILSKTATHADSSPLSSSQARRDWFPSLSLSAHSQRAGRLNDVYIPKDYHTQEPKGIAFVEVRRDELSLVPASPAALLPFDASFPCRAFLRCLGFPSERVSSRRCSNCS